MHDPCLLHDDLLRAFGRSKQPTLPKCAESYQDKVTFTPYANWLIPGHLMVGRYPYVEPSRCP